MHELGPFVVKLIGSKNLITDLRTQQLTHKKRNPFNQTKTNSTVHDGVHHTNISGGHQSRKKTVFGTLQHHI